jgi:hypothetical protein
MPGGRPTKLDTTAANDIVAILEKGLPIDDACAAVGIDDSTFQRWMRKGEKALKAREPKPEDQPFREFCAGVKKARSLGKLVHLTTIEKASTGTAGNPGDWKAAAWLLERMHPKQFGRKYIRIEAGGPDGEPMPAADAPAPIVDIVIEGSPEVPLV